MKDKKLIALISALAIIVIVLVLLVWNPNQIFFKYQKCGKEPTKNISTSIEVVPTLLDEVKTNSAWVPTFQLIWNDFVNVLCNGNVEFEEKIDIVKNLNEQTFTENMISGEYYYKTFGRKTLELKQEIERNIKYKFNQESDILDLFDWSEEELDGADPTEERWFLYSMLYRKFEYNKEFKRLEKSKFKDVENVEYFGIDTDSPWEVTSQIKVLFYDDDDNFGISLKTKTGDEVILYKNPKGTTFKEILENFELETSRYNDRPYLKDIDTFKMPLLKINVLKEYKELEKKRFITNRDINPTGQIEKAMQTVKFTIDEKGGEVKSEAGMDNKFDSAVPLEPMTPRHYELDNTFVLMLKESDKKTPYLMLRVDDITKFQ